MGKIFTVRDICHLQITPPTVRSRDGADSTDLYCRSVSTGGLHAAPDPPEPHPVSSKLANPACVQSHATGMGDAAGDAEPGAEQAPSHKILDTEDHLGGAGTLGSEVCQVASPSPSTGLQPQAAQQPPAQQPQALTTVRAPGLAVLLQRPKVLDTPPLPQRPLSLPAPLCLLLPAPPGSLTAGIPHILQPRGLCTALITAVSKNRSN